MDKLIHEIFTLANIDGVSGDEWRVADYITSRISAHVDEIKRTRLGCVVALKRSGNSLPARMICAHMDEIGFIVTAIQPDGTLAFAPVGGIDIRVVLGKRVRVYGRSGCALGVIGLCPVHLASDSEKENTPEYESLRIDIGCDSAEQASELAAPGDYVAFVSKPELFGNGLIKSKAIDDRCGSAAMLCLLDELESVPRDTYFVFTTREEIGGIGALTAAFGVPCEEAAVLEGTTAADVAGVEGDKRVTLLGGGAAISRIDGSAIYSSALFDRLTGLADGSGIKWQMKRRVAGGTDAGQIQFSRGGVACTGISVPVRYIHAPSSVASISDIESMYKLAKLHITLE